MELPRIQYITHPDEQFDDLSWVHRLYDNGIRWIQLRLKEEDVIRRFPDVHYRAFFHETADKLRAITTALGMLLTINDELEVALFSAADGLHIGQEDADPKQVENSLNAGQFLGGTANSLAEALHFEGVALAYFGVGPFRATSTKSTVKPVLGIAGYEQLLQQLNEHGMTAPIFAIGGITAADVRPLLTAGVYGIALSGSLFSEGHSATSIQAITNEITAL